MATSWTEYERHPLSAEYGDLSTKEREKMVAGLKKHGNVGKRKVILHDGKVIDAWQFYQCCIEAEIRPEFDGIPQGIAPEDYVETVNDRRRHETPAQAAKRAKKRRNRVEKLRDKGMSLRAIAEEVGTSETQVRRDLNSGAPPGAPEDEELPESLRDPEPSPKTVTGKDGKKYTASKAKKAKPEPKLCERCTIAGKARNCPECAKLNRPKVVASGDADEDVIKDAEGQNVPDQARAAFKTADILTGICKELDSILRRVEELSSGPGCRLVRFESFKQQIKDAKGNLWANRATHVCPYCLGKKEKCECCLGEGWTARHIYQQAPGIREKSA